jgi:hypothetical protein
MNPLHSALITLSLAAAATATAAASDDLPAVGLDDTGAPVEIRVPRAVFRQRYLESLTTVHDSALPALRDSRKDAKWKLRTVVIGVGMGLEAKLGPVIKAQIQPRYRAVFSNAKDPVLP